MAGLFSKFRAKITQFRRAHQGAAVVEFALIMPLLLLLYLGTVEGGRLISYDRRLTTVASSLGDLVARHESSLSEAELDDYFTAAAAVVSPMVADTLEQVVTNVLVDDTGDATVAWSRAYNGGTARVVGEPYILPQAFRNIAHNRNVIVSEAEMIYEPLTTYAFEPGLRLYKEFHFLPRFGGSVAINP